MAAKTSGLSATNLSKAGIEAYAAKVATAYGFQAGQTDVRELVKALGGTLESADLTESGYICVRRPGDFVILLPPHTSLHRDTFTIAHELGHYFLHARQGQTPIEAKRDLTPDRAEWEANWFAAALLMPATEFEEIYRRLGSTLPETDLAAHFGVSEAAAEVRLRVLGLEG